MAWKISVAGVDFTQYVQYGPNPRISMRQNERTTASFSVKPSAPSIAIFDEVIMYEIDGTTPKFRGVAWPGPKTRTPPGESVFWVDVQCVDFAYYIGSAVWTKIYTVAVSLGQMMADVVADVLGPDYGITVDGSQDTGPDLEPFVVTDANIMNLLRDAASKCDPPRVVVLSPGKALRILVPGTTSAPFAITDLNTHVMSFDWGYSTFAPANSVLLRGGGAGNWVLSRTFIGDGSTTSWQVEIAQIDLALQIFVNGVDAGGVFPGGPFELNLTTMVLTVGTAPTPGVGDTIQLFFQATGPFAVKVNTGATPASWAVVTDASQQSTLEYYLQGANGALARLSHTPRLANLTTKEGAALTPAQSMNITYTAKRVTTAVFTITSVDHELTEFRTGTTRLWFSSAQLTETTKYQGSYLDQMRAMLSGGSSSITVSGGGTTPVVLSGPIALGGIDTGRVPMSGSPPAYADAYNYNPYVAVSSFVGLVRAYMFGLSATPAYRVALVDNLGNEQASSWINAATRAAGTQTFYVNIVAGRTYRLRGKSDTNGAGIAFGGQLEQ